MAKQIREDHLFTVEKSIFANSHLLFFWVAVTIVGICSIWVFPIFADLVVTADGNVLNLLLGSLLTAQDVAFFKSPVITWICIGLSVVSVIVIIFIIINIKMYKALFYADHIVIKGGFIARWEKQMPLTPIVGVHMDQTVFGRIFDYASFTVEKIGHDEWSLASNGKVGELNGPESILFRVSEASAVKECLEELIMRTKGEISSIMGNHETKTDKRNVALKPIC
jgi:uncharacterized membrane protein YdbT with pleckstrin-like domain